MFKLLFFYVYRVHLLLEEVFFFFFLVHTVLLQTSIAFSSTISSPFTLFCIQGGEESNISTGAMVCWGVFQVMKFLFDVVSCLV